MGLLTLIANSSVSNIKIRESSDVTSKSVATASIILDWYGATYCVSK